MARLAKLHIALDMQSNGVTDPLRWFWAINVNGITTWITADGMSATPAPFLITQSANLNVVGVELAEANYLVGTVFRSVMFLHDGSDIVALDAITAVITP